MKFSSIATCLCVAALATSVQAQTARMYKCVDAKGKSYYSDKMNPDCAKGTELNRHGVVMPKREVDKPAKPSPAPKSANEQARRDRALMATYTTEEEIDAARDRTLVIPLQGAKSIESKLEKANRQLTDLKDQADAIASQKKALPAHLLEDINGNQRKITALEASLEQRKSQSDAIRLRFEADKQRFRELKGQAAAKP